MHNQAGILLASENDLSLRDPDLNLSVRPDEVLWDPHQKQAWVCELKSTTGKYTGGRGTIYAPDGTPYMPKIDHALQVVCYLHLYPTLSKIHEVMEHNLLDTPSTSSNPDLHDRVKRVQQLIDEHGDRPVVGGLIVYFNRENEDWSSPPHQVRLLANDQIEVNGQLQPFTAKDMKDRLRYSWSFIEKGELPPRDYSIQYSSERISRLAATDRLSKTNMSKFKKGQKIELSDWRCNYCNWSQHCWSEGK